MLDLDNYRARSKFCHKHLLTLGDYSTDDILQILSLAIKLKKECKAGIRHEILKDKILAMIFTKPSARTRLSFEVGIRQLGGSAVYLTHADIQLGIREPVCDMAQVLSRYADGIMIRTFAQADAEGLAKFGSIPVINGLTDLYHPCQALADMLTVYEYKKAFNGVKLAFIGDGNNMLNSLMIICAKLGMSLAAACPENYLPDAEITARCIAYAAESGGSIEIHDKPEQAAKNADIVYTDVFASMGQEHQHAERLKAFMPYQVDARVMDCAKNNAIFMHCLPAHRGEEVSAEVIDGPHSVVFDQAENRLHAQKAVMAMLMK